MKEYKTFIPIIVQLLKKSSSLLDNCLLLCKKSLSQSLFFALVSTLFLQCPIYASWYDQKLEGWYYFQETPSSSDNPPTLTPEQADILIAIESRKLKQQLSLAILSPTDENVRTYIEAQRCWIQQSNLFAQMWGKTLLEYPELSEFLTTPTSSYGILAKKTYDLEHRKELLQALSKDYFLLFFFKSSDPLSQKAAEVTKLFATSNDWKFKAVSLDGIGMPELQGVEIDNGISSLFEVRVTPCFFIVNPTDNQAYPVGAGLVTVSEIEQNIETQLGGFTNER